MDLRTEEFSYNLPPELIAHRPAKERDQSRLMVLNRMSRQISHESFSSIVEHLKAPDVLVVNRSKVIPARLIATKETGGRVELLLSRLEAPGIWRVMARPSRRLRRGVKLKFEGHSLRAVISDDLGDGEWLVSFDADGDVNLAIREAGTVPLPPYINAEGAPLDRYQTVYADRDGSIAAPTAGLHFSTALLEQVRLQGIDIQYVTLHVGIGTFKPVTAARIVDHRMHGEWGEVSPEVVNAIHHARERNGRVIAVGTTTVRILESAASGGVLAPFEGETNQFIFPGYRFRVVDALVTNFHLPRSTLLMLVSAFAGREFVLKAYEEAIQERYRFFSFGDAMLIT